jgi:hypothetical protein
MKRRESQNPANRSDENAAKWHLMYCDRELRSCPVTDFIESSPPKHQVKIVRFLSLLEEMGPLLPRPYADLLRDGIHELRIKLSGDHVRLLYFFCYQRYIVLYHAFVKNTDRVPEKYIRDIKAYRDKFLLKFDPQTLEDEVHAAV